MDKIAFKPHKTRGQEIIKILENMGGINKYQLDGSQGSVLAIETNRNNCIADDWAVLYLLNLGYKIYTLEEYEEELCEKTPSSPTTGLVGDEIKPKFKVGDVIMSDALQLKWKVIDVERTGYILKPVDYPDMICDLDFKNEQHYKLVEDELLNEYEELTDRAFKGGYEKCKSDIELNGFQLPEGYIFKDENGNEINATKIVLEKKKKEYPKTYEECCKVLNLPVRDFDILYNMLDTTEIIYSNNLDRLLNSFRKLLICRDAYWKIAGDEMGLGKSWESDWREKRYIIYLNQDDIIGGYREAGYVEHHIFEFPTPEMRDAFKENFDPDIEICKELL